MASSSSSSDDNAKRAFGLIYLTEEKDWSGRTTTYRDIYGNIVGTSENNGDRNVYRHPDGQRTWGGNSDGK
jgi:hypothetical protein